MHVTKPPLGGAERMCGRGRRNVRGAKRMSAGRPPQSQKRPHCSMEFQSFREWGGKMQKPPLAIEGSGDIDALRAHLREQDGEFCRRIADSYRERQRNLSRWREHRAMHEKSCPDTQQMMRPIRDRQLLTKEIDAAQSPLVQFSGNPAV